MILFHAAVNRIRTCGVVVGNTDLRSRQLRRHNTVQIYLEAELLGRCAQGIIHAEKI